MYKECGTCTTEMGGIGESAIVEMIHFGEGERGMRRRH
jgi:hypothetical protein